MVFINIKQVHSHCLNHRNSRSTFSIYRDLFAYFFSFFVSFICSFLAFTFTFTLIETYFSIQILSLFFLEARRVKTDWDRYQSQFFIILNRGIIVKLMSIKINQKETLRRWQSMGGGTKTTLMTLILMRLQRRLTLSRV